MLPLANRGFNQTLDNREVNQTRVKTKPDALGLCFYSYLKW